MFVAEINIALVDDLVHIAVAFGLPADDARTVLEERNYAAAVEADWQRARELGITAVPTHLCGSRRLTGFSGYEDFVRLIGKSR